MESGKTAEDLPALRSGDSHLPPFDVPGVRILTPSAVGLGPVRGQPSILVPAGFRFVSSPVTGAGIRRLIVAQPWIVSLGKVWGG